MLEIKEHRTMRPTIMTQAKGCRIQEYREKGSSGRDLKK